MKHLVLTVVLALLLSGCADSAVELPQAEAPQPEETFFRESSADHHDPRWTEQELLTAFYQYAEEGTAVIDCVVVPDSAYGIVGVVQYTEKDEEGCWFDFLKGDGIPRSVGVLTPPAGKGTLEYIGDDTVTCTLLKEDRTEYTCTISCYEIPENRETGFKIVDE